MSRNTLNQLLKDFNQYRNRTKGLRKMFNKWCKNNNELFLKNELSLDIENIDCLIQYCCDNIRYDLSNGIFRDSYPYSSYKDIMNTIIKSLVKKIHKVNKIKTKTCISLEIL